MTVLPDAVRSPQECIETLAGLAPALDAAGVRWWLDYGSLLGYVREGGFIGHDSDIDLGVWGGDMEAAAALAPALKGVGLDACYHPPGPRRFESGDWFHVTRAPGDPNGVDLFPWYQAGAGMLDRTHYASHDVTKGRSFPIARLLPLSRATWEGVGVWVPADPDWVTAHRYGATWRDPIDYRNGDVL